MTAEKIHDSSGSCRFPWNVLRLDKVRHHRAGQELGPDAFLRQIHLRRLRRRAGWTSPGIGESELANVCNGPNNQIYTTRTESIKQTSSTRIFLGRFATNWIETENSFFSFWNSRRCATGKRALTACPFCRSRTADLCRKPTRNARSPRRPTEPLLSRSAVRSSSARKASS